MKEKLSKLLDLKSLVTLAIVGVLCQQTIVGNIEAQQFLQIATIVIMFYFTKPNKKVS